MRATSRTFRSWVVVVALTVVVSLGFSLLGLPSPVLFGSLVAGMAHALVAREELDVPPLAFRVGQALVGAVIGALVQLPTLLRIAADWPSVVLVTLGTLAISVAAGRLLALDRDVSQVTGAFALVAGGASGIVALARELGADDRVVTIVQYLRVLLVLLAMPVVTSFVFHPPTRSRVARGQPDALAPGPDLRGARGGRSACCCSASSPPRRPRCSARCSSRWPSRPAACSGHVSVPTALENLGYALIGVRVGLRFTRASLRSIARLLPLATALIVAVIVACGLLGLLLAEVTGTDRLTAYLATTPGGLFAVLATAADSGSDVTYVLAVQVIRVFAMLLLAPAARPVAPPGPSG